VFGWGVLGSFSNFLLVVASRKSNWARLSPQLIHSTNAPSVALVGADGRQVASFTTEGDVRFSYAGLPGELCSNRKEIEKVSG
jgi:hypothetical protein